MRSFRPLPLLLAVAVAIALAATVDAEVKVPALVGRVDDYAHLLTPGQTTSLDEKLAQFERQTSNQIAVLTVPSLGGEDLEGFSIRVAEAWKIGQKGRDNGVLVVVAPTEKRVRIEVGYGLEGALPDAICSRIIREIIGPAFAAGNWYAGLDGGVSAIMSATKGEYKALPGGSRPRGRSAEMGRHSTVGTLVMIVLFILMLSTRTGRQFLFFMMLFGGRGGRGSGGGDSFSGGGGSFGGGGASGSW